MRIVVDAREISVNHPGGLRSYTESVVNCLSNYRGQHEMIAAMDRDIPTPSGSLDGIKQVTCPPQQLAVREQFTLPRMLGEMRADVVHFPANTAPLTCPSPYVLTVHDTFCIDRPLLDIARRGSAHDKGLSLYFKYICATSARRADRIITVSQYSAQQIARLPGVDASRITVIPQSLHPRYRRVAADDLRDEIRNRLGVAKLVLIIGSTEPRKNLKRALMAVDQAMQQHGDLGLVLVWPKGVDFIEWSMQNLPQPLRQVHLISNVGDEELVRLYSAADVFVFASLREGFGLPVVEAMACGCPVVSSNATCLPDTAGGAALLVDPDSTEKIAAGIVEVLEDTDKRRKMIEQGQQRVMVLSQEHTARRLLQVYEECAGQL